MLRDCKYVAYYMGVLAHMMADVVYYSHTLRGLGLNLLSQITLMDYVSRLTNTKYPLRTPLEFPEIKGVSKHLRKLKTKSKKKLTAICSQKVEIKVKKTNCLIRNSPRIFKCKVLSRIFIHNFLNLYKKLY